MRIVYHNGTSLAFRIPYGFITFCGLFLFSVSGRRKGSDQRGKPTAQKGRKADLKKVRDHKGKHAHG